MLYQPAGNFQSKSGFAGATWTCKRHQLNVFAKKGFTRPGELILPSNQGGGLVREIVRKVSRRLHYGVTARPAARWIFSIKLLDLTRTRHGEQRCESFEVGSGIDQAGQSLF